MQFILFIQGGSSVEAGQLSDTTASAPGSDDEAGSTAATDGSTLRTSPADQGPGSAGSESGGSAGDSVSGNKFLSSSSPVLFWPKIYANQEIIYSDVLVYLTIFLS